MLSILGKKWNKTKLNSFEIDATLKIDYSFSNTMSQYPIEDNSIISDFIKKQPKKLTIEGLTTDTPLFSTTNTVISETYSNNAFIELINFAGYSVDKQNNIISDKNMTPVLLNIVTGLCVYTNMIITNITFNHKPFSITYTIEFQELKKIKSREFTEYKVDDLKGKAKNIKKQNSKKKILGENSKKEINPQKSTLYKIFTGK
jgi:hypothetical protein